MSKNDYNEHDADMKLAITELYSKIEKLTIENETKLEELKIKKNMERILYQSLKIELFKSISIDDFNIPNNVDEQIKNQEKIIRELESLKKDLINKSGYQGEDEIKNTD